MDILPLLDGWRFDLQLPTAYTIPAGGFQETYHEKNCMGYILGISGIADNPLLTLEMIHWGPKLQERRLTGSPFAVNAAGLVGFWNASGFYVGTYSAVTGVYTCFYHPDSHIGNWVQELRIRLLNPTGVTINVSSYSHTLIRVFDEKAWRKSLHKLLQAQLFRLKLPEGMTLKEG